MQQLTFGKLCRFLKARYVIFLRPQTRTMVEFLTTEAWIGFCFAGLTCNEKKVIEILGRRTKAQRDSISERYKLVFGESLQKRVKSAMSNKLLARSVSLWLMEPSERDAVLLCEALKEVTPKKDRVVIGILCSRTSAQIYQIKQAFYTLFNQTLENHVDGSAFDFSELQTKVRPWLCGGGRGLCFFPFLFSLFPRLSIFISGTFWKNIMALLQPWDVIIWVTLWKRIIPLHLFDSGKTS